MSAEGDFIVERPDQTREDFVIKREIKDRILVNPVRKTKHF